MKKKILYVITQTEWGGAQKYIYELITSEQAKNYDILVAVGDNKDKTLIDKLKAQNVPVRVLKHLVRPISPIQDILVVFELKKLYQEIKPDIIHTSSSKPSVQGSIAFKLSKLENTKLIHTVHGWVFNESISTWKKKMYLILEKITAKYKSLIIFISNHDKQSAIDNNITIKNSVIIHNGIDLDESALLEKSVAREKLNLPQDKIIIGTVANLYKTKGLEYFIEATNLLVRKQKYNFSGNWRWRIKRRTKKSNCQLWFAK